MRDHTFSPDIKVKGFQDEAVSIAPAIRVLKEAQVGRFKYRALNPKKRKKHVHRKAKRLSKSDRNKRKK